MYGAPFLWSTGSRKIVSMWMSLLLWLVTCISTSEPQCCGPACCQSWQQPPVKPVLLPANMCSNSAHVGLFKKAFIKVQMLFSINGGLIWIILPQQGSDVWLLFFMRLQMKIVIFSHLLEFCIQTWLLSFLWYVFRRCALYYKFFWNCVCQKRHRSSDSTASGRDRSYSTDSADMLPGRLKEEPWLLEISSTFLQQYVQYLQSMGFILVQVRPQSPARRCVECVLFNCCFQPSNVPSTTLSAAVYHPGSVQTS